MQEKPVALVTGANRGIGLQIARELASRRFIVLVGSRDVALGQRAAAGIDGDAHALQLDVTDRGSITAAAQRVRDQFGRLDVLVNNAGVNAGAADQTVEQRMQAGHLTVVSLDEVRRVFETNVFAVIAVTQAMLPLLRQAPVARVVNLSSSSGSLTLNSNPAEPRRATFGTYAISKVALNAVTVAFAADLDSEGIMVNSADPGLTATELTNFLGTRTVEQGAQEPVRLALLAADGPTGTYSNEAGPIPW